MQPLSGIKAAGTPSCFICTNQDPQLLLIPRSTNIHSGLMELQLQMDSPEAVSNAVLYFDTGQGFSETTKESINIISGELTITQVEIPAGTTRLRFDPCASLGDICIKQFNLVPITRYKVIQSAIKQSSANVKDVKSFLRQAKKGYELMSTGGFRALSDKLYKGSSENYAAWVKRFDTLDDEARSTIRADISTFTYKPLVSVVMPTYNTAEKWLSAAIESVQAQLYQNWELCIADDCSPDGNVRRVIKGYAAKDRRVKYIFRKENGHISASSNSALSIATGEFVALLDHDDLLNEAALYRIVQALNQDPNYDVIYSDEDKVDELDHRYDPYFKPDWMPDLYNSQNFTSHLSVYRKRILDEVGGFRQGYEGAQDWDLMMRISEIVPHENIQHVPHILYHWRAIQGSTAKAKNEKSYVESAQEKTILDHFKRTNTPVELMPNGHGFWKNKHLLLNNQPLVSIITPTKNRADLLRRCIKSILEKTSYSNYEILVVDNASDEEDSLAYFEELEQLSVARVLNYSFPFNYSAINNFAVNNSKGEVVVLLNNDTEVITPEWLDEMVSLAVRPWTGAVGAKLYYPDDTIQHGGVVLGIMGVANHAYLHQPRATTGQMGRAMLTQNYSAVTGACLAIEKRKYLEVGGLNEIELKVAFNDIDFCLKLLKQGYLNVWTPYAELYHYESASRGDEDSPEKKERFKNEVLYMLEKWRPILQNDPAYNLNLSLDRLDFGLAFPPRIS